MPLFLLAFSVWGQGSPAEEALIKHLETFASLHPREEGSGNESKALDYIKTVLSGLPYSIAEISLKNMEEYHSFSHILDIFKPGIKEDEIVLALPINSSPASRSEEASLLLAIVLTWLETLPQRETLPSIRVLFLGSETGSGEEYPLGSREYLKDYYPPGIGAFIYIDIPFAPEKLFLDSGTNRIITPPWLLTGFKNALRQQGIEAQSSGTLNQIYRLGYADSVSPIYWYMEAGYPALRVTCGDTVRKADPLQWANLFIRTLDGFIAGFNESLPREWDTHYLLFTAGNKDIVISEGLYVIIILLVLFSALLYPVFRRRGLRRYLKSLKKDYWALPLLLGLLFLFLITGTALGRLILRLRNSADLWTHFAFMFFLLKTFLALFLLSFFFQWRRFLLFSYNSSFYSASALLFLLLSLIVTAVIDISLSFYFLWAFIFCFLFSIVPRLWLKILLFFLSLFWIIKAAYDIFSLPALRVSAVILFSWFKGNILLSMMILPFFMMLIRLDFLLRHPAKRKQKVLIRAISLLLGASSLALTGYLSLADPFSEAKPQIIRVSQNYTPESETSLLLLESGHSLGEFSIITGTEKREFSEKAARLSMPVITSLDFPAPEIQYSKFLDRVFYRLTFTLPGKPDSVNFKLRSEAGEIIIYDSNYPFSIQGTGETGEIHIGQNPPLPLYIEVTLPAALEIYADMEILYSLIPYDISFEGKNKTFQHTLEVNKSFSLPVTK